MQIFSTILDKGDEADQKFCYHYPVMYTPRKRKASV